MLLFYAIVPAVLLTLLGILIYWGVWRYSINNITRKENALVSADINTMVNSYSDLLYMLESQEEVFEGDLNADIRVNIFEQIYEVSNRLDRKANVYVFDRSIKPIITGTNTVPEFLTGRYAGNWGIFRIMNQNPNRIAIKLFQEPGSDGFRLVVGKAMLKEGSINGYAAFVIDSAQFRVTIAKLDTQTVITDENGWVFVSNNYSFLDTLGRFQLELPKMNANIKTEKGSFYIASSGIQGGQLKVYSITALDNQIERLQYIIIVVLLLFAIMFLSVILTSKVIAVKKTKDLYTIIETFEKAKEGDLETHIEVSGNDEFETIAEAYNQMLDSLKEQIERNKEMSKLVAFSQMKQLESQFNPHFLFNTLENIRFMCKLEPESASKMVQNLSILLRYSISNQQEEVTVTEDIAYTENYLSLLKFRFNQRFQYSVDISPEIESCIIPKLLIQPMIENSIKYGFHNRERMVVEILGYMEGDHLVMICSDDGVGMKPELLKEIRGILASGINRSSHTGLYNINRRLQLKYGEGYGIQIESEYGKGTTLKVALPVIRMEGSGESDVENINC
jgi:two-component system sensor histidine kinase YesM